MKALTKFWNKLQKQRKSRPMVWGMVIDLDKCTGCAACVQACRSENNIPFAGEEQMDLGRGIFWMEILASAEGREDETSYKVNPLPCMQCDNPPCIKYCPTRATETNREGVNGQVYARCIGCRYCTVACPYTRRFFNWHDANIPKEMEPLLNPDVTVRYRGVVEKCNFCYQRIREGKWNAKLNGREIEKGEISDGEIQMACEQTCPSNAIVFGNLQDIHSKVHKLAKKKRTKTIFGEIGAQPKTFYLDEEDVHVS